MNVVLATDGNAPAEAAGRLLAHLARRDRTEVTVVAVCGFETVLTEAERVGRYDVAAGRERAEKALDTAVARLRTAGLRADGTVAEGEPAGEILAAAARRGAGLIAVGAGHTRRFETLLLGSTSTTVLHGAGASVLVVHDVDDAPVRVLVGTDGSDGSARAARAFADLADPARCEVLVVAATGAEGLVDPGDAVEDEVRRSARGAAARTAADTARLLRDAGFEVRTEVADGPAGTELLDRAEEHDLVVVGCRGRGVLRRALLGSVSDAVVRRAPATLVGR
jgi:nucleotide-binding universal stress UspA family protein